MRARTLRYLTREGFRGLRHHGAMTLTSVVTMAAGLLVLGAFLVVSYNIVLLIEGLENRKEVVVYLKEGLSPEESDQVAERFTLHPAVSAAVFVSREEAWEQFAASMETEGLLDAVGGNPLPDGFRLELKPEGRDAGTIQGLALEVSAWQEVEEVLTGGDWVSRMDQFSRIVMLATLVIGIAVALSIVAIIANTVRLTIVVRKDLIEIMKLVGASESFIRIPFLSEGMTQSLLAAALALGLLYGGTVLLGREMAGVAFLSPVWCAGFVGFALVLGLVGSLVSVRHVLRQVGL